MHDGKLKVSRNCQGMTSGRMLCMCLICAKQSAMYIVV